MKKAIAVLAALCMAVCISSCADFTKYPSGVYKSDFPYFYYDSSALGDYSAKIDYQGKRVNANLGMLGNGFNLDISGIFYDEEGEPYTDEEGMIANGTWSLDKKGNMILDFDNGNRIVLRKQ